MILNLVNPNNILKLRVESGPIPLGYAPEGTIFVVTDVPHTSYIYSYEEPSNPTQGMIWIKHDMDVNYPILAFQKRSVDSSNNSKGNYYAYPSMVYQYIDGNWVGRTYYIYNQYGESQSLDYYIIQNSKLNPLYHWEQWIQTDLDPDDFRNVEIKYQNGIFIIPEQWGYYVWGYASSLRKIDVTNYSQMIINVTKCVQTGRIYCGDSMREFNDSTGIEPIDLSNMTGEQTLKVYLAKHGEGNAGIRAAQLGISELYLKR